jgi:hypothetical protein
MFIRHCQYSVDEKMGHNDDEQNEVDDEVDDEMAFGHGLKLDIELPNTKNSLLYLKQ